MISIPYDKVKATIKEQTGLSEKDIDAKVKQKLASLSGLISQDGAIHIIANELGVKLIPDRENIKVKDLIPGMRDITLNLRVLRKYEVREFERDNRKGKVGSLFVGDESGVTRVTLWNEQADKINSVEEGMTIQVKDASVKENQGRTELHLGMNGDLILSPSGVTIEVNKTTQERNYTTKKIGELSQSDEYVDLLGTLVQAFDPRNYTKRDGTQGTVVNAILDDGTGTIRVSFWDADVKTLLGDATEDAEKLIEKKHELLGQIVKVRGRAKLNPAYNTVELACHGFTLNPDPQAELSRLE